MYLLALSTTNPHGWGAQWGATDGGKFINETKLAYFLILIHYRWNYIIVGIIKYVLLRQALHHDFKTRRKNAKTNEKRGANDLILIAGKLLHNIIGRRPPKCSFA